MEKKNHHLWFRKHFKRNENTRRDKHPVSLMSSSLNVLEGPGPGSSPKSTEQTLAEPVVGFSKKSFVNTQFNQQTWNPESELFRGLCWVSGSKMPQSPLFQIGCSWNEGSAPGKQRRPYVCLRGVKGKDFSAWILEVEKLMI